MCSLPYRPAWWLKWIDGPILTEDDNPPGWVFKLSKKIGREAWKKL